MSRQRILLADDNDDFLVTVKDLLSEEYEIVGAVRDGIALVSAARATTPDVIISDISMPQMNGFQAARELLETGCSSAIIFMTIHSSARYVKKAFSVGARGYVLKIYASEQLPKAIVDVLAGRSFISPQISMVHRMPG